MAPTIAYPNVEAVTPSVKFYGAPLPSEGTRALDDLRRVASVLQLPSSVVKRAEHLLLASKSNSVCVAAACLLLAVRERQIPLRVVEIAELFNLKPMKVVREAQELYRHGLAKPLYTPPEKFLERIASKLELSDEQRASLIREAIPLIQRARELNRTSGHPAHVIAAAAAYAGTIETSLFFRGASTWIQVVSVEGQNAGRVSKRGC